MRIHMESNQRIITTLTNSLHSFALNNPRANRHIVQSTPHHARTIYPPVTTSNLISRVTQLPNLRLVYLSRNINTHTPLPVVVFHPTISPKLMKVLIIPRLNPTLNDSNNTTCLELLHLLPRPLGLSIPPFDQLIFSTNSSDYLTSLIPQ